MRRARQFCLPRTQLVSGAHPTRYAKLAIEPGAPGQAVDHGWKDVAHMASDPDLVPVREHPGYKALVQRLKSESKGKD